MPRFMGFVRMEEGVGTPPQALFDAMDKYIGERAANGVFLDGDPYDVKTRLLHDDPSLVSRSTAVRTDEWTYVYRAGDSDELYDRSADPGETTNVASDPALAKVVVDHRDRILRWLVDTSDVVPVARDPQMEPALVDALGRGIA
jgi:hypothetical protein